MFVALGSGSDVVPVVFDLNGLLQSLVGQDARVVALHTPHSPDASFLRHHADWLVFFGVGGVLLLLGCLLDEINVVFLSSNIRLLFIILGLSEWLSGLLTLLQPHRLCD